MACFLYHHFPNKPALGHAVVEEVIRPLIHRIWIEPVERAESPLEALTAIQQAMEGNLSMGACELGCPLNNLAQEMSPVNEGFRKRLDEIFGLWREAIARALRQGQQEARVRSDIDPHRAASFIIAAIEGSIGMAKNTQNSEPWNACQEGLEHYIESLLEG